MKLKDFEHIVTNNITKYLKVIGDMNDEIAKCELIKSSLTESLVDEVRTIVSPYSDNMLREAWLQQGEKKKSDRPMYEFVKKDLFERLGLPTKTKLTSITACGYDGHCYSFYFAIDKVDFEVRIPNIAAAKDCNISDMHYGKHALYYNKDSVVWELITCSYDLEEIGKAIKGFVEERNNPYGTNTVLL